MLHESQGIFGTEARNKNKIKIKSQRQRGDRFPAAGGTQEKQCSEVKFGIKPICESHRKRLTAFQLHEIKGLPSGTDQKYKEP